MARKIGNFKSFENNTELDELKDLKRSFTKNELDQGLRQHKSRFNKVTRKNDDVTLSDVEDNIEAIESAEEIKENQLDAFYKVASKEDQVTSLSVIEPVDHSGVLKITTRSGKTYKIQIDELNESKGF